jgi:hypothetical protein
MERFRTIERVFACEDNFRRLLLRFEHLSQVHYALKTLAYTRSICGITAKRQRWYEQPDNGAARQANARPLTPSSIARGSGHVP